MDVNKITLDQPAGPKASNAPRGGDGSFQVAYAKVLSESYAPVARERATAHPLRGQDSPLINRVSVTIPRKVECRLYLKTYTDPNSPQSRCRSCRCRGARCRWICGFMRGDLYSVLIPASFTTFCQRARSSRMYAANCSGVLGDGSSTRVLKRSFVAGIASTL